MSTNTNTLPETIELKLPTGRKIHLRQFEVIGTKPDGTPGPGKRGYALLHPDTGTFHGFGVVAPPAAKHLPAFVEIEGIRVDLVHDQSKAGNPRVNSKNKVIPIASAKGSSKSRAVIRIVDEGENWNYVLEVLPASENAGGGRKPASGSIFAD